jgi:predicted nucleic acid-binding protein
VRRRVILDTGPLVAFLNREDRFHAWAVAEWDAIEPPMLTCEAVLSEACFLLRRTVLGSRGVLALVERDVVRLPFRLADEAKEVARLLGRYARVPMSLADACLVRLAERHHDSAVFTLDADFRIYRKHGRQVLPTIMPEGV